MLKFLTKVGLWCTIMFNVMGPWYITTMTIVSIFFLMFMSYEEGVEQGFNMVAKDKDGN